MSDLPLIEAYEVNGTNIELKFGKTIKTSSINLSKFVLTDSSDVEIANAFRVIVLSDHYNSIGRILRLYWDTVPTPGEVYTLRITNLVDAAGTLISDEELEFIGPESAAAPTPGEINPDYPLLPIEDHSIKTVSFASGNNVGVGPIANGNFYITDTDPDNGSYYVSEDHNKGRVTIIFNTQPAANFLAPEYFKAQRKLIQRTPSRWEDIDAMISMHSDRPHVFLDYPSIGDTPVYNVADETYFEKGYKYRIRISKHIGI